MKTIKDTEPTPRFKAEGERFTAVLKSAAKYDLLSVHEFDGVKYKVVAVMPHEKGVAVEFVREN